MTRQLILAIFFLCAPARAEKTDFEKTPVCSAVPPIVLVERETVFHPVYVPRAKVYGAVNIFYAREMLKPCEMPGRRRSYKDAKCYRKSRLP